MCGEKGATIQCGFAACKLYVHPYCALQNAWQFNLSHTAQKGYMAGVCCPLHYKKRRGRVAVVSTENGTSVEKENEKKHERDGWFDSGMFRDYVEYGLNGLSGDITIGEIRALSSGISDNVNSNL